MSDQQISLKVVPASTALYATIFGYATHRTADPSRLREIIKLISAAHATCTTAACLYALTGNHWHIEKAEQLVQGDDHKAKLARLDDSQNPLIWGTSDIGNAVTSFETGYLVYDTIALLLVAYAIAPKAGVRGAVRRLIRTSPVFLAHHVALISALGLLQVYIVKGRERGVQVIVAFILMNASNPILHARWFMKKRGYQGLSLDVANAGVFALTRFGIVAWVLHKYAAYHGMNIWQAFRRQRAVCQTGTGTLSLVNAVWLAALLAQIGARSQQKSKKI